MPFKMSGSLTSGAAAVSVASVSASSSGAAAEKGGMICAETVRTEPKMNVAASTGSLVQPKPVENSIVLPASPAHACRHYNAAFGDDHAPFGPLNTW